MQWRQAQGGGGGAESPNLDPLLHQFQPPGFIGQRYIGRKISTADILAHFQIIHESINN